MITIPIAVCGDDWVNRDTVVEQLKNITDKIPIKLDLNAEGPSLHALGIVDVILDYLHRTEKSTDLIYTINWPNSVEQIAFQRLNHTYLSHFFWFSETYQHAVPKHRTAEYLFGYFVGRRTVPRCIMLKHIQEHYTSSFLLSLMNTVAGFNFTDLDPIDQWCDPQNFHNWYNNQHISSLDNHTVRDQYLEGHNTNASLLRWYHKFDIEIVAETYCHGDTFFITEKTVRPIVAGKSMLVYGPRNYLERLRNLGFQTWDTIWDESYDQLTGPDRWRALQAVIADLITRDQEQLYQQCASINQYNQQHADLLIEKYKPQ